MSQELARHLIRQSWRVLAYEFGQGSVTAERIAQQTKLPVAFVRSACELAGYHLASSEPVI